MTMKTHGVWFVLVCAAFGWTESALADRLAFVNLRRAMVECEEGKAARQKLGVEVQEKEKTLDGERTKLKELSGALAKDQSTLKGEELDKRRLEVREKYLEVEKRTEQFKNELRRREAEIVGPLSKKLLVVVAAIAQREKLTHVLREESLLWTESTAMDLTNEVIRLADSAYRKEQAQSSKSGDAKPDSKQAKGE
jgi:outer membrane protein